MEELSPSNHIHYKKGYKYQLHEDYVIQTELRPERDLVLDYIILRQDGLLIIRHGYAWDGPSGPTVDTPSFMRGSLVHDVIYQLIGEGLLDVKYRLYADQLLREICLEDDMWKVRAWWVFHAVDKKGPKFGSTEKTIYTAP